MESATELVRLAALVRAHAMCVLPVREDPGFHIYDSLFQRFETRARTGPFMGTLNYVTPSQTGCGGKESHPVFSLLEVLRS